MRKKDEGRKLEYKVGSSEGTRRRKVGAKESEKAQRVAREM